MWCNPNCSKKWCVHIYIHTVHMYYHSCYSAYIQPEIRGSLQLTQGYNVLLKLEGSEPCGVTQIVQKSSVCI